MDNLANRKTSAANAALMPNFIPKQSAPINDTLNSDFIRHPAQFPLEVRRTRAWSRSAPDASSSGGDLGLCFVSAKRIPAGTDIEISIPLRGEVQKFHGSVVMVREIADGYEIGVWLANADEASRVKLVEQICQIECRLMEKAPPPEKPATNNTRAAVARFFSPRRLTN